MIKLFLKAKHWQLFLAMIVLPIVGYIYFVVVIIQEIEAMNEIDPNAMGEFMKNFIILMIVPMAIHFTWFWSLGFGLQKKIRSEYRLKTGLFRITVLFPVLYFFGLIVYGWFFITSIEAGNVQEPPMETLLLIPLHFLSIGCMFYNMYFVARTIKTAEMNKPVEFSDYIGEFFLMWFYIIGIWIIQPKVNNMKEYTGDDYFDHLQ